VIARLSRTRADGEHSLLSLGPIGPACWRIDAERSTSTAIAINIDTTEPLVQREPVTLRFSLTPYRAVASQQPHIPPPPVPDTCLAFLEGL